MARKKKGSKGPVSSTQRATGFRDTAPARGKKGGRKGTIYTEPGNPAAPVLGGKSKGSK